MQSGEVPESSEDGESLSGNRLPTLSVTPLLSHCDNTDDLWVDLVLTVHD